MRTLLLSRETDGDGDSRATLCRRLLIRLSMREGVAHNGVVSYQSIILTLGLLAAGWPAVAQNPDSSAGDSWKAMQALIGQWDGALGGQPGQGTAGSFTVTSDLQGHALVRRSFAEFPATKDHAAIRHDDLTIIYQGDPSAAPRATYSDREGRVIECAFSVSYGGNRIELLSAVRPAEPRFRFTYVF